MELEDRSGDGSAPALRKPDDATPPQPAEDEAATLANLPATMRNQDDLEKAVGQQADQALLNQANARDQQRLERAVRDKDKLEKELAGLRHQLETSPHMAQRLRADIGVIEGKIESAVTDRHQIKNRMKQRQEDAAAAALEADQTGTHRRPGETNRDFLIRTGKITPFARMSELGGAREKLADALQEAEAGEYEEEEDEFEENEASTKPLSHRNLAKPGFSRGGSPSSSASESPAPSPDSHVHKRRKIRRQTRVSPEASEDDFDPDLSDEESESEGPGFIGEGADGQPAQSRKRARVGRSKQLVDDEANLADVDDGNEEIYQTRLHNWEKGRKSARQRAARKNAPESNAHEEAPDQQEHLMPHPTVADEALSGGFMIPGDIYPSLFDYQKTGVRWLWELHQQKVGGIIGDEMGLGKTIQAISLLASLHHSGKYDKPIIVVCPATIMKQWVSEFHRWWPPFRVSILHTSGSGMMNLKKEAKFDDDLDNDMFSGASSGKKPSNKSAKRIVDRVLKEGHVLVTTYAGLQSYADVLLPVDWGYAILDEGHKIRNPNSSMTIYCKELRTPHRLILSGTPMQNNLTELWSLFDFVFPMRLGTLLSFRDTFDIPIKHGGYAKASNLEVETAFKCAEALKDTISPYLLQRWKSDVAADLPAKSERVLFCKLTQQQRTAYENFLRSNKHKAVEDGRMRALYSIDMLRKICNHPDMIDHKHLASEPTYGAEERSGKMQVVRPLLQHWKDTGHKTLLFAQHRIMLDVLEKFIKGMDGINYQRMDGTTAIKDRQHMVDEFNNAENLHVFLLTTKVGGLGVNLVGADRVIIYDPDWNPSTDVQARERAWRLGQKREVLIFRLMTAGTIEEKIYHRQLSKQFLSNKVLKDPKQRPALHQGGMQELFVLGGADEEETETGALFKGSETRLEKRDITVNEDEDKEEESVIPSIEGINHSESIQDSKSNKKESSNDKDAEQNHFMESLLGNAGVHASLSHDAILGQSSQKPKLTADPAMITREAKRVAAEAAARLRLNEEAARNTPIGTPTWTGEVGVAGRPVSPRQRGALSSRGARGGTGRGGPSSSSVLAHLAARQTGGSGRDSPATPEPQRRGADFMKLIRDYIQAQGGRVYTKMLIDHFTQYCTTAQRTADFTEMLRTIAVLDDGPGGRGGRGVAGRRAPLGRGGRGQWTLKKEFGGPGGDE